MSNIIDIIEQEGLRTDLPDFRVGQIPVQKLSVGAYKASEFIDEFQSLLARLVETYYECRERRLCRGQR